MRIIPSGLAAQLASGVTTLAYAWKLTRRDGAVYGFTDHDSDLVIDGLSFEAASGFSPGAIEKGLGLAIDTASVEGALSSNAIDADDLAAGLWDGARVDLYRVDWSDPSQKAHVFAGRLGEARRGETAFAAELRGLQAPLNTPVGRVFSRFCDAEVGDSRCGIDLGDPLFGGAGSVDSVLAPNEFLATGLSAFAANWFARGRIQWASGAEGDVAGHRVDGAGVAILLADTPNFAIAPGDSFTITAGCDKRLATCTAKFANAVNYRGFPHMPGNDSVQSGPATGAANDGGSRWIP